MSKKSIHISVRNMIEFVLKCGDIDLRYTSSNRSLDGIKIHQKLQKEHSKKTSLKNFVYNFEIPLKITIEYNDFLLEVEGRADGIIDTPQISYIEEIKSTLNNIEDIKNNYNNLHWAQAKCYGYIYCKLKNINSIVIIITYCSIKTFEEISFEKEFKYDELEKYFYNLTDSYFEWIKYIYDMEIARNNSINKFNFPYSQYRKGQYEFASSVYKTIVSGKKLFAQASTGIGKTISTLFPAIKYIGLSGKENQKIFYLTAKNITRQVAEDTLIFMNKKGLKLKFITITAKDKICMCEERICVPQKCLYAKGHFDRINDAVKDILENVDCITIKEIQDYSKKHIVCPFEFSLDIALFADCIICDYNYVFDLKVQMKRFFNDDSKGNYIVLIDEAHNLVDRSREMFSALMTKDEILKTRRALKSRNLPIYKSLSSLNKYFLKLYNKFEGNDKAIVNSEYPEEVIHLIMDLISKCDEWLQKNESSIAYQNVIDIYFKSLDFIRISELFNENYTCIIEKTEKNILFKLFCIDPSFLLAKQQKKLYASIFFSATLNPIKYFIEILGGSEGDNFIKIPSPFDTNKLCLIIDTSISTKYLDRHLSYEKISERIYNVVSCKSGNYIVFFPSYKYLQNTYETFEYKYPQINKKIQYQSMKEEDKNNFLSNFNVQNENTFIGFAVLGGAFSEGIDLIGKRLIGVIIIGVGLPLISIERNIISDYYKNKNGNGFEYSYIYPGMNKVFQASGRVIRSEEDIGTVVLIDSRFSNYEYRSLFPYEWKNYIKLSSLETLNESLKKFWKNTDK